MSDFFEDQPPGSRMDMGIDLSEGRSIMLGRFYKRAVGGWTKDQRKDEDPRHQFGTLVIKTRAMGFSTMPRNPITLKCERCDRLLGDIIKDHLTACPAQHPRLPSGDIQCSWNIEPLCEGERRSGEDAWLPGRN